MASWQLSLMSAGLFMLAGVIGIASGNNTAVVFIGVGTLFAGVAASHKRNASKGINDDAR